MKRSPETSFSLPGRPDLGVAPARGRIRGTIPADVEVDLPGEPHDLRWDVLGLTFAESGRRPSGAAS